MKMVDFWVVVLCSLLEVYRRFRGLQPQSSGRRLEAASICETSVDFTVLHGATTQKTASFIFDAVRTSNLTKYEYFVTFRRLSVFSIIRD
jgi:hypothetical protein